MSAEDLHNHQGHAAEDQELRRELLLERSEENVRSFGRRVYAPRDDAEVPDREIHAAQDTEPAADNTPGTPMFMPEDDEVIQVDLRGPGEEHAAPGPAARELQEALDDLENGNVDAAIDGITTSPFPEEERELLLDRLVQEAPSEEIRAQIVARIERVWVSRSGWAPPQNLYQSIFQRLFGAPANPAGQRNRGRAAELTKAGERLLERLKALERDTLPGPQKEKKIDEAIRAAIEPFSNVRNQALVQKMVAAALIGGLAVARLGLKAGAGAALLPVLQVVSEWLDDPENHLTSAGQGVLESVQRFRAERQLPRHGFEPAAPAWWQNIGGSGRSLYQLLDTLGSASDRVRPVVRTVRSVAGGIETLRRLRDIWTAYAPQAAPEPPAAPAPPQPFPPSSPYAKTPRNFSEELELALSKMGKRGRPQPTGRTFAPLGGAGKRRGRPKGRKDSKPRRKRAKKEEEQITELS